MLIQERQMFLDLSYFSFITMKSKLARIYNPLSNANKHACIHLRNCVYYLK